MPAASRFRSSIVLFSACCGAGFVVAGVLLAVYLTVSMPRKPMAPEAFDAQAGDAGEAVAQPWELTGLDGGSVRFADLEARVLFVNRWATWCAPCVREMPTIEALSERLAGEDVAFLMISSETLETVRAHVENAAWRLPVYVAGEVPAAFGSSGIPATFIVDAQRRIALRRIGSADWDDDAAEAFVRGLLSAAAPQS